MNFELEIAFENNDLAVEVEMTSGEMDVEVVMDSVLNVMAPFDLEYGGESFES